MWLCLNIQNMKLVAGVSSRQTPTHPHHIRREFDVQSTQLVKSIVQNDRSVRFHRCSMYSVLTMGHGSMQMSGLLLPNWWFVMCVCGGAACPFQHVRRRQPPAPTAQLHASPCLMLIISFPVRPDPSESRLPRRVWLRICGTFWS